MLICIFFVTVITGYQKDFINMKKLKFIFPGILFLILILATFLLIVFRNELKSLSTLKVLDRGMYQMTYVGDYGFDDFLLTGAQNDKEIETFIIKRLLHGIPIKLNITDAGCTAFVAQSDEGNIIFARNFDFVSAPSMQVFTKPKNGYASVSTVNLSFAGYSKKNLPDKGIKAKNFLTLAAPFLPFDGMNEKGVTIALLAVPKADLKTDENKVTLNTTTMIRLVLDKAATVSEAVSLIKKYNIYFSGDVECHYLIADASGKSSIVEFYDGEVRVVEPKTDYQIASNFIAYNDLNIGEGFTEFKRYDTVKEVLERQNAKITIDESVALLNKIGIYSNGIDKLQWSVVYNSTDLSGKYWTRRSKKNIIDFELRPKE